MSWMIFLGWASFALFAAIVVFCFGIAAGHWAAKDHSVRHGGFTLNGVSYRVSRLVPAKPPRGPKAEASEIVETVKAGLRDGAFDADLARALKRNDARNTSGPDPRGSEFDTL